jgi:hypothetical protein
MLRHDSDAGVSVCEVHHGSAVLLIDPMRRGLSDETQFRPTDESGQVVKDVLA